MQHDKSRLKIHTKAQPEAVQAEPESCPEIKEEVEMNRMRALMRRQKTPKMRRQKHRDKQALTTGEKLLRNTAVSCALLLSVLALKNVEQPWSQHAADGIRQAVNMRIDWDDTLGKLSFVRALVPDTALVFLNLGTGVDMNRPVNGQIVHEFTGQQPWLEYSCAGRQPVCAAMSGIVAASGQGAGGEWIVMIQSGDNTETVYGYLEEAYVEAGQSVEAGQQIGSTANEEVGRFYFELRENGVPADPSGRMK